MITKKEWSYIGKDELNIDLIQPIKNQSFIKPLGGLWLSSIRDYDSEYITDWHEFLVEELNRNTVGSKISVVDINKDAKIYVIDTYSDLVNLYNDYKLVSDDLDSDYFKTLDFEKISKTYDAIILTDDGQRNTRFTRPGLYGWDIECMLVLNANIIKVKNINIL